MNNLNFNKLAWDAPNHDGQYGYLPTDEHYAAIQEWINSGTVVWEITEEDHYTARIAFPDSQWDALVERNIKTELINWTFRRKNEYHI